MVTETKRWRDSSQVTTVGHCTDVGGCPNSSLEARIRDQLEDGILA